MANVLLNEVRDCLETQVYSTAGRLAILEQLETQCLNKVIEIFKNRATNRDNQTRKCFKSCEVSRLQFPKSQRQRSGNRQPVRYCG